MILVFFGKPEDVTVMPSGIHAAQCDFVERFGEEAQYESMYGEKFSTKLGPKRE